ncbi:MAG: glycosyltransferase family 39 protein [Isosphaeraceae bacterium]
MVCAGVSLELRFGWIEPVFDAVAHLFYEVPVLARVRRPSQLLLVRGHLAVLAALTLALLWSRPWLGAHSRRWGTIFLLAYVIRATAWIVGSNLPLVPGDSSHYVEVARSVARGEGAVKHYVESFFRDYPAIRADRGVLDDWSMPLYPYLLGTVYRVAGVETKARIETLFGLAKGLSFLLNLLALPALYGLARRHAGRDVALTAMLLLAVFPVHAIYAGFALRESLVALTSILAVWGFLEVIQVRTQRVAWFLAVPAGVLGGLAILSRNTAMALLAGCVLYAMLGPGRRRAGPIFLWGLLVTVTIVPWGWATYREYGQPFYTYTNYFPYNFSWTVHHYEKGNTEASQFYTAANASEIVRVKLKSICIMAWASAMILSLPVAIGFVWRVRRGGPLDRMVATIFGVFVVATLVNVADVTQVAQLGRYFMPVFVLALPSAATAGIGLLETLRPSVGVRRLAGVSLFALLWADPTWAYDAGWYLKEYQLRWEAIEELGTWIQRNPKHVPENARVMTWFPWEVRVAADRTTVLLPRNYRRSRVEEVIRQYGVTHIVWGSFEPPPHVDVESWAAYLESLRLGLGLTETKLLHASSPRTLYPLRLYRVQ